MSVIYASSRTNGTSRGKGQYPSRNGQADSSFVFEVRTGVELTPTAICRSLPR